MDEHYLQRCADLAQLADGRVGNSPTVGAVLVYEERIIGEGFHRVAGQAHAEVNCLASVAAADRHLVQEATLYVSLEPCCITGRSGACTDLIRRQGIKTVVFGQRDSTPGVNGDSVRILERAGVTVREYPDFVPTQYVNAHRRVMATEERPYVILKYAKSADGFLRPTDRAQAYWITNGISRRAVHRWRAETAAILVGGRTVVDDNPALTTRLFPGPSPRPIIVDPRKRVMGTEALFSGSQSPLVFTNTARTDLRAEVWGTTTALDKEALTQVLGQVLKQGYGSLLVEGGLSVLQAFLAAGLWDEARIFTGSIRFGDGLPAPTLPVTAQLQSSTTILSDRLDVYRK